MGDWSTFARRQVWMLLTLLLGYSAYAQQLDEDDFRCNLSRREIRQFVNESSRTWTLDDVAIETHGLQGIINCTAVGDTIFLETTRIIQPPNRLVIPWRLTLETPVNDGAGEVADELRARITCPTNEGLFLIGSMGVVLRNLVIQDCRLSEDENVMAVIETDSCPSELSGRSLIRMQHVDFVRNRNLGGSVGLVVQDPSCFRVVMQDVLLQSNRFRHSSSLSARNDLRNVRLVENEISGSTEGNASVFYLPPASRSTVQRLFAEGNQGIQLSVERGVLDILDSNFSTNTGIGMGVIVASSSEVSVSTSRFSTNACQGIGAVVTLSDRSNGTFTSVRFENNSALVGSAVYLNDTENVRFDDCVFNANLAHVDVEGGSGFGGVACVATDESFDAKSLEILNCTFNRNVGHRFASALYFRRWHNASVRITDTHFLENGEPRRTLQGGAIRMRGALDLNLRTVNSTFVANGAHAAGAAAFQDVSGECRFQSCRFLDNAATHGPGGGLLLVNQVAPYVNVTFEDVVFGNNTSADHGGGAFLQAEGLDVRFRAVRFFQSKALHSGAVYVNQQRTLSVENCTFEENEAEGLGGAVRLLLASGVVLSPEISPTDFRNCAFVRNKAASGGALYAQTALTISDCQFRNNEASEDGGAVVVVDNPDISSFFSNTSFIRNRAAVGGALYLENVARVNVTNCSLHRNNASLYGGGVYLLVPVFTRSLVLANTNLTRNTAWLGGGAYFQVDADNVLRNDNSDWSVSVTRTNFTENFAERAGGGFFVENLDVLDMDCRLNRSEPYTLQDHQSSRAFSCRSLRGNSVGTDGYGDSVATSSTTFFARLIFEEEQDRDPIVLEAGDSFQMEPLKSGEHLPIVEVVAVDQFHQGPALTKTNITAPVVTGLVNPARRNVFAKATIESFDGLIPNQFVADVSTGAGNVSLGEVFRMPENYSFVLWMGEDRTLNITVNVPIRECIINEEAVRNATLCQECDSNHFNYDPNNGTCRECPEDSDCSSAYVLPSSGQWNAFPCSRFVQRCINADACQGSNVKAVTERFGEHPDDCTFEEADIAWYKESLCAHHYEGPLCGSCTDSSGKVGAISCRRCVLQRAGALLLILISIFITMTLSVLQIKGNLDSAKHRTTTQYVSTFRSSRLNPNKRRVSGSGNLTNSVLALSTDPGVADLERYRRKEDDAKWRFLTLLKITMNFLQTVAAGFSLDLSWNDSISRLLQTWDWIGGAAVESSGFTLDCLLSTDASTPRTVMREILVIFLPIFVFFMLCAFWGLRAKLLGRNGFYLMRRCVLTLVVVSYVSYIALTRTAINTFYCVEVHDGITVEEVEETHHYWALDTNLRCLHNSHATLAIFVAAPVLFFSLVFPVSVAVILVYLRFIDKLESDNVREMLGFFFRGFEEEYVYWDSVILLRKALLATVVVFSYSLGGNLQGLCALTVLVGALFLQTTLVPFRHSFKHFNQLESISLFVSSFTFLAGVILNDNNMTSPVVEAMLIAMVFISNLGLSLSLFCLLVNLKLTQFRFSLMADGIDCESYSGYTVALEFALQSFARFLEGVQRALFKLGWMKDSVEDRQPAPGPELEMSEPA